MRIALVTPYSWTYPGGVNRHVESLSEELLGRGHEVHVLAPWDPPDRLSTALHRLAPEPRQRPDHLIPLGRTVGFPANGAVSNLCISPAGVNEMRRRLRAGRYDVVHVHEPIAPAIGWDAPSFTGAPVVGTFHAYSTEALPNRIATLLGARAVFNRLHERIAVSEAAAWTGRRWFGGEYTIVPNGVDLEGPPSGPKPEADGLRVLFVGRPEERKGLPVLLNAFGALVDHVPARLTVVGSTEEEVARLAADPDVLHHIDFAGRVSRRELWRRLHEADVLCAPSLSGESFGMVLTEAFAAGTPVIASRIAGYSDVVTDGVDGELVPPTDATALAEALHEMHLRPDRRREMGEAARRSAERYSWPRVADRVIGVYERAMSAPEPVGVGERLARGAGLAPAGGGPKARARRLSSLEPAPASGPPRRHRVVRRLGATLAALMAVALTLLAIHRVGPENVVASFVQSSPSWVLIAFALMTASLFLRAASWVAIARAALPGRRIRRRDVTSATMIGVLMSATLPARLGEPARAMVLSRNIGRMRETLPVLVGTLISQTVLNIVALVLLGVVIVSTTHLFHRSQEALFLVSLAPVLLLTAVLLAPALVRGRAGGRVGRIVRIVRDALVRVRSGLLVFRAPRRAAFAASAQLGAWGLQLLGCYALFVAMGLDHKAGIGAAAAVLFAVNVTAVVPATPSNIGVFQLAVISVLSGGFGIGAAQALGYGIILQAVEIATAVALGVPSLVREGMTWSGMRARALQAAPARLSPAPGTSPAAD